MMKKWMRSWIGWVFYHCTLLPLQAQTDFNYEVRLRPVPMVGLPALHAFAHAQHEGKWLIIGGRKDGLHARQPFNAFPSAFNNTDIYVVDIQSGRVWSKTVLTLPTPLAEALQATNYNYYQDSTILYLTGGYAYAQSRADHMTFPQLTSVDVPGLMAAIMSNQSILPYFQQVTDDVFAVTGGQLAKWRDTLYLVGGHRFDGRYNPRGNPTFTQAYTNQIRKFTVRTLPTLAYTLYPPVTDPVHLHRRDYNLVPQIFPDRSFGYMLSAGVFQPTADIPFSHTVDIKEGSYYPNLNFNQYLNQYHCPKIPLYDSTANAMHTLFFGGMSQFYYQNEVLIQDDNVPFVPTIARVVRRSDGSMAEFPTAVQMPHLRGAGAEFFLAPNISHYAGDIIKLNTLLADSVRIGYIYGGIISETHNPFVDNTPALTRADTAVYEVLLIRDRITQIKSLNGENPYRLNVSPNPSQNYVALDLNLKAGDDIRAVVALADGKICQTESWTAQTDSDKPLILYWADQTPRQQPLYLSLVVNKRYYLTATVLRL